MKSFLFALAIATSAVADTSWHPVQLKGVLTHADDSGNLIRTPIVRRDLISTNANRLVLELDFDAESTVASLRLLEVDPDNLEVAELATSTRAVFLPGNLFAGDLVFTDLAISNASVNIVGDGNLQVRGSYTTNTVGAAVGIKAKFMGVCNDPVNGASGDDQPAMFKGDLISDKRGFDPNE